MKTYVLTDWGVRADEKEPLTVTLYSVETSGCAPLFDGQDPSTRVVCR